MKIADQPTEWVLVRTSICPTEKPIDYILLHLTPEHRALLRQQFTIRDQITAVTELYCVSFHSQPLGYFCYDGEGIAWHLGRRLLNWAFIEFDVDYELKTLKKVKHPFTRQYVNYFASTASFHAISAINGEILITREFPLDYILECFEME